MAVADTPHNNSGARSHPNTRNGGVPSLGTAGAVLELRNVVKRFGDVRAVDGITFAVQPGEVFTLLGPSGCGKTTTLRMIAGLEHPDEGDLLLNGRVIASAGKGLFLPPERRNMGMVFQSYAIWPHMTVFENVAFPLRLRRTPGSQIKERVQQVLEVVGLDGYAPRPATNLSGGQQQRVALARALVYNPEILLLDEPLSNLDAKLREHMRIELRSLQRRLGIAVLLVTHDQVEAMTISDRVGVMSRGRFEHVGPPSELYERPATPFVRDFLGRALSLEGEVRRDSRGTPYVVLSGLETSPSIMLEEGRLDAFADGSRLLVALRPEDTRLEPSGPAAVNRVRVIIEDVAYLGDCVEYTVRPAGGTGTFVAMTPRRERHAIGARVDLLIDPAEATVWPHEAQP